jgi:hypothetical protein
MTDASRQNDDAQPNGNQPRGSQQSPDTQTTEGFAVPGQSGAEFNPPRDDSEAAAVHAALVALDINSPVELTGLPATLEADDRLQTFVEGVGWRIDRDRCELELTLTDATLSIGSLRWGLVSQTLTWDDVPANLEWQDARSI